MLELLLSAILLTGPVMPQDTLFEVGDGVRLELSDLSGQLQVESWDRNSILVEVDSDERAEFRVNRSGRIIRLGIRDGRGRGRSRARVDDARITIPKWMDVEITGPELEVDLRGLDGDVRIRIMEGEIVLEDLSGSVDASNMEGSIEAAVLRGTARLRTGDNDLVVSESSGDLNLETVSGDIEMWNLDSQLIVAESTTGKIDYSGRPAVGGEFTFRTHNGDVTLNMPESVNLDMTLLAYHGEVESDFRIRTQGFISGKGMEFTVGDGGAKMVVEVFNGDITLSRWDGSDSSPIHP